LYLAGAYAGTPTIKAVNSSSVSTDVATLPGGSGSSFIIKFDQDGAYSPTVNVLSYSIIVDSSSNDAGYSVSTDSSGNMYLAGAYAGTPTITKQGGTPIATLPASTTPAAFATKFDSNGNYQYSIVIDSTGNEIGYSVTTDSSGNMYLAGYYNGTPTIKYVNTSNVSTNVATLPASGGGTSAFVSKFDSNGNYQYSMVVPVLGYSVATDSVGNMYLAGYYTGPATIQYVNSSNVSTSVATLPATGVAAAFVSKFDSSGTYLYSRIVDSSGTDYGRYVTTDLYGNMYLAGYYTGTPTIKYVNSSNVSTNVATLPGSGTGAAAFVSKFDSSGNYLYSRVIDSSGSDQSYSVTTDSSGNMYLAGIYNTTPTIKAVNTSNVSTSVATLPVSSGGTTEFCSKFDSSGNYLYSIVMDTSGTTESVNSVTTDPSGNMYISGYYYSTPTIYYVNTSNVSTSLATLPASSGAAGTYSAFLSKFDSSGSYLYSRILDPGGTNVGYSVASDSSGNMYLAGAYAGTPSIENETGTVLGTLPTSTGTAAFITKFGPNGSYSI
jgi:hypothetical protein